MPSDQEDLSAARAFSAARDAATPGTLKQTGVWQTAIANHDGQIGAFVDSRDAAFFIAARNSDLPERIERLVAENERLKSRLRKMHSVCTPENCILDGHPEHEEFFMEKSNDH
jgi:hypothetical protein